MGKERFYAIMKRRNAGAPGLWLGDPRGEMLHNLLQFYGVRDRLALAAATGEDLSFLSADPYASPTGGTAFQIEATCVLANCESVAEIERYDWPTPCQLDLDAYEAAIDAAHAQGLAVAGGMWCCFFHYVAALFGMENYFICMHTNPQIVHAATRRVVDWLLDANARIYARLGTKLDAFFMGNDFGTQQGLLISPAAWRQFIKPYYRLLLDQAKRAGLICMVHSCGAIGELIPDLIELKVDALHPLQALARGMDADALAAYRERIAFVGGIDAQRLLPTGTPAAVNRDVMRVAKRIGHNWIVSPSHEGYQTDVSAENINALVEAVQSMRQSGAHGGCL